MATRTLEADRYYGRRSTMTRFGSASLSAVLAVIAFSAITGVAIGLAMPRGPVTTDQAILLMTAGLVLGVGAGVLMPTRWAYILVPALVLVAFELTRLGETGPTVDGLELGSTFGILAFVSGRGIFILLGLIPIMLGVLHGRTVAAWRRRGRFSDESRARTATRAVALFAPLLAMALVGLWIARPASVPALTENGDPLPGSVSELQALQINDSEQWIEIRGATEDLPVLLYLSGGPGQSDLALSRALLEELTNDFIVVGWDQRGTGKSYGAFDPDEITPEVFVADAIEITNYLRERFDEEKIYLMGESWGSLLGILTIQEAPGLFHAYIGSGQMVSPLLTDQQIYDDLLAEAERTGDDGLANELRGFGPPPYDDLWAYGVIMQHYELLEGDYDPPQEYIDRGEDSGVGFWGIMGSEYAPIEKVNVLRGLIDVFAVMYPQLQEIDLRTDALILDVPIYIFDGEHELAGRRDLALEWYAMLDAPIKEIYTFENAGHAVAFEHADYLHRILLEEILPATYPAS